MTNIVLFDSLIKYVLSYLIQQKSNIIINNAFSYHFC